MASADEIRVHVKNLKFAVSEAALRRLLLQNGQKVQRIYLVRRGLSYSQMAMCSAFIHVSDQDQLQSVIQVLDGQWYDALRNVKALEAGPAIPRMRTLAATATDPPSHQQPSFDDLNAMYPEPSTPGPTQPDEGEPSRMPEPDSSCVASTPRINVDHVGGRWGRMTKAGSTCLPLPVKEECGSGEISPRHPAVVKQDEAQPIRMVPETEAESPSSKKSSPVRKKKVKSDRKSKKSSKVKGKKRRRTSSSSS